MKTYISQYLMNAFTPKKLKTFPPANQCRYCYRIHKILRQMSLRIRHDCARKCTMVAFAPLPFVSCVRIRWTKTIGNSYTSESVSRNILAQYVSSQTQSFSPQFNTDYLLCTALRAFSAIFTLSVETDSACKAFGGGAFTLNKCTNMILPHFDGLFDEKNSKH